MSEWLKLLAAFAIFATIILLFLLPALLFSPAWETPDAVACADNAELLIEVIPGPRGTPSKHIERWDFLGCTAYWYT
jgi:hypothetical protein